MRTHDLSSVESSLTLINAFLGNWPKKWCTSSIGCNTAFKVLKISSQSSFFNGISQVQALNSLIAAFS